MNPTKASSFRRTACGLCLLIGPAMILLASILDPAAGEGGETREYLRAIVDDPDMTQVSTALWMYGFALTAIGIIGAVHVIRGRGVTLANIGGAAALIGMIMFMALFASTIHDLNAADKLGVQTAERLSDDLEDYWVPIVVLATALLGTLIGFILLGAALIRSRVVHIAAGGMIILGILMVPASEESQVVNVLANVLLLAGWGLVGLKLLTITDEQWEGRAPIPAEPPTAAVPPPAV